MDVDRQRARATGACYQCGQKGHLAKDCLQKKTEVQEIKVQEERMEEQRQGFATAE